MAFVPAKIMFVRKEFTKWLQFFSIPTPLDADNVETHV